MNDQNNEEIQQDSDIIDAVLVPHIEDGVPIPKNSQEALPNMSTEQEVNVRAETIKQLSDITGEEIKPDHEDVKNATEIAEKLVTNPGQKQDIENYPNETIAFLAGMVNSMNHMIVKDLAQIKLYVLNNLIRVVETTDNAKEKTAALRAIGEIDGVDAFKKKTEVTHKMETMEEVEKELLSMLAELKEKGLVKPPPQTIDAEIIEVKETKDE
jgi:hypothetical protein